MFLHLAHTQLNVYRDALKLIVHCNEMIRVFPAEERYNLSQQIKRASLSAYLNIAEGCSRKSAVERNRFFEVARGSAIEVGPGLDVAVALKYINEDGLKTVGPNLISVYKQLSGLMTHNKK